MFCDGDAVNSVAGKQGLYWQQWPYQSIDAFSIAFRMLRFSL